jgi:methylmalonyl-CoA mutase cobalamin-binding subunit
VLKPDGKVIIVSEVYRGANTKMAKLCEKYASQTGMTLLDVDGHRELFAKAGYSEIELFEERGQGWICVIGGKP